MRAPLKVITEKQSIAMQFYCQIIEIIFSPLAWAKHTVEEAKKTLFIPAVPLEWLSCLEGLQL